MTTPTAGRRTMRRALLILVVLPFLALGAMNLFINLGVPPLVNGKPDKVRVQFTFAWSWWPGEVDVWGLEIRGQGKNDQWTLTVDRAEGTIDLRTLLDREFRATGLRAKGGSFRYRFRADGPVDPALDATPPIPGLTNPPDPPPDPKKSPMGPFKITLVGLEVQDLREVWLEDFRFAGSATATGDLKLGDIMAAHAKLVIPEGGQLLRGKDDPLVNALEGEVEVGLDGIVRGQPITMESLTALDARARVSALTDDLSFLEFYLQSAPWLTLDGRTALAVNATLVDGEFMAPSMMNVATGELSVGFVAYEIRGDGIARLEVIDTPEGPSSRLGVRFGAFTVREGAEEPLVEGTGFQLAAVSPDTSLIAPLTSLHVVLDLMESTLPDMQRFARYLPTSAGIQIVGGTGTVRSHVEAWAEDGRLTGTVDVAGHDARVQLDNLVITTDLSLHTNLAEGAIGTGVYDFTGTRIAATDLSVVDLDPHNDHEEQAIRGWWARMAVTEGRVSVGAPTYLDTTVALSALDSAPFVRVATQTKPLPGWVQRTFEVRDLAGSARLQLGEDTFVLNPLYVAGGQLEVQMRMFREGAATSGAMYARYGKMSVAVDFDPAHSDVHVLDAMDWYSGEHQAKVDAKAEKHAEKKKD